MKTQRRAFLRASTASAAGVLLGGRAVAQEQDCPPIGPTGAVTLRVRIWGTVLYVLDYDKKSQRYTFHTGFFKGSPEDCKPVMHSPELVLPNGLARQTGGNAVLDSAIDGKKWRVPEGRLTISGIHAEAPRLCPTGVDDKILPCPPDPTDWERVKSLGFIPRLKATGNFSLPPNWDIPSDHTLLLTLDHGHIMASPPAYCDFLPNWHYRTDNSSENDVHAFTDTTRYEVALAGTEVEFSCGGQNLVIQPGTPGSLLVDLRLNAAPPKEDLTIGTGKPLPHFCSLYGAFRAGGAANGQQPGKNDRYVPRMRQKCVKSNGIFGEVVDEIRSPAKYCSGALVVRQL
jgi:hypothetical protein